jgi:putative transposase
MIYNPDIHHRRSIRLKGYDYSQAGAYFVTLCAWNKEYLFGEIVDGKMLLNEYGEIVIKCWEAIPSHFVNVGCDEFVVMPNHVHGIITITNVGAQFIAPSYVDCHTSRYSAINQNNKKNVINQGAINRAPTVGGIMRSFKARCTCMINQIRNTPGTPVWQRNYYEHIIRDDRELQAIREYIRYNPIKWNEDEENPEMKGTIQKNA